MPYAINLRSSTGETFKNAEGADVVVNSGDYVISDNSGTPVGALPRSIVDSGVAQEIDLSSDTSNSDTPEPSPRSSRSR